MRTQDRRARASRDVDDIGSKRIFRYCSRKSFDGGKNYLGFIVRDWSGDDRNPWGFYWEDLTGNFGRTFVRLREALADFDREMETR